jgi:tight adherence protein C
MTLTLVLIAGAICGVGILALVLLLDVRPARGPAALARLDLDRRRFRREAVLEVDALHAYESMRLRRVGAALRESLEARGIRLPAGLQADLAITGRSVENHLAISLASGLAGLMLPLLLVAPIAAFFGLGMGLVPLWIALLLGGLGAILPSLSVQSRAADLRRDFRHVVSSFLDLVAMNLSGGRGVPEALEVASSVSTYWGMSRIREKLRNARLQGVTPWSALGELGQELAIDELRDLASALTLVAEDGAKVRDSLFARASSMRQRELADAEGRAAARSQSMVVAQMLLAIGFLTFLIFPAVARLLGS